MKTLFLDFNGTLIDDVDVSLECLNIIRRIYLNSKPLDKATYRKIFTFPVSAYYRRAGFDFQKVSFEKAGDSWFALYLERLHKIPLAKGVNAFLKTYQNAFRYVLLTASQRELIMKQLTLYHLENAFDAILANDDIYAYGKLPLALKYQEEHPDEKCALIGDTLHDLEVARALKIPAYILNNGHQDKEILESEIKTYDNIVAIKPKID